LNLIIFYKKLKDDFPVLQPLYLLLMLLCDFFTTSPPCVRSNLRTLLYCGDDLARETVGLLLNSPLALCFPLTLFKPGAGFGTFFSPKRLELSAFHESSLTAAIKKG